MIVQSEKLPVILGLGIRSTQFYITQLQQQYHEQHGDYHTFPHLLYQVDFNTINPFLPDDFDTLLPTLKHVFQALTTLPAAQVVVPNITLHEAIDQLPLPLQLVHPVTLTLAHLKANNISKICLFGSLYSMNAPYLSKAFKDEGIQVIQPTKQDAVTLDELRKKVYNSTETKSNTLMFEQLINTYTAESNVVICCTELSVIFDKITTKTHVVDMALIQIQEVLTQSV